MPRKTKPRREPRKPRTPWFKRYRQRVKPPVRSNQIRERIAKEKQHDNED